MKIKLQIFYLAIKILIIWTKQKLQNSFISLTKFIVLSPYSRLRKKKKKNPNSQVSQSQSPEPP